MKAPQTVSFVQPLISRGEEIRTTHPIIAYFCFYAAVRQVLETKLHSTDQEVAEFATALLNEIESMKSGNIDQEILDDDDSSRAYVLNFASAIFNKADKATQNQQVTRATGAGFAAAAVFLGLEGIWGELDPETIEKIRYSKFQATRILKAIKNGEDPNSLYPVESQNEEAIEGEPSQISDLALHDRDTNNEGSNDREPEPSSSSDPVARPGQDEPDVNANDPEEIDNAGDTDSAVNLPEPPHAAPEKDLMLPHAPQQDLGKDLSLPPPPDSRPEGNVSPPPPPPPKKFDDNTDSRMPDAPKSAQKPTPPQPPKVLPKPAPQPASSVQNHPPSSGQKLSPAEIMALTSVTGTAQKHAKYAISALNYDDITTAISELEQALYKLKVYQENQS